MGSLLLDICVGCVGSKTDPQGGACRRCRGSGQEPEFDLGENMRSVRLLVDMQVPANVTDKEAASLVDQATTRSLTATGLENPVVLVSPAPDLKALSEKLSKLGKAIHEIQAP
jgi:hypothetical protein